MLPRDMQTLGEGSGCMSFSWTMTATRATSCLVPAGDGGPQPRQLVEYMSATSDWDPSSIDGVAKDSRSRFEALKRVWLVLETLSAHSSVYQDSVSAMPATSMMDVICPRTQRQNLKGQAPQNRMTQLGYVTSSHLGTSVAHAGPDGSAGLLYEHEQYERALQESRCSAMSHDAVRPRNF